MHYFGDNFVTLGPNTDLSDYWHSSCVAGYSLTDCRLMIIIELTKSWKYSKIVI